MLGASDLGREAATRFLGRLRGTWMEAGPCTRAGGSARRSPEALLWRGISECAGSRSVDTGRPTGSWQQWLGHLASPEPTPTETWISQRKAARTLASVTHRIGPCAARPVGVLTRLEFPLGDVLERVDLKVALSQSSGARSMSPQLAGAQHQPSPGPRSACARNTASAR